MTEFVVKAKLVAIREGEYTKYVFHLENGEYIMCTRLPNWETPNIKQNEDGFLRYKIVSAGEKYRDSELKEHTYHYNAIYFDDFVKETRQTTNQIIL